MNNEINKQVCTNCKYFRLHYIVDDCGALLATCTGHCVHTDNSYRIAINHVFKNDGCSLWQPYELQKLRIQYGIEQKLQYIGDKVNEILAVLRDVE